MKLRNKYFLMRHGEALSNVRSVVSGWPETFENPLTKNGEQMVKESAVTLVDKNIHVIFASPLLRTKQTAEMVGKTLKLKIIFDERLREVGFGILNGKPKEQWDDYFNNEERAISDSAPGGETYNDVMERVYEFICDIDKKYEDKNILIVSHQCPLWVLENKIKGLPLPEGIRKDPQEKRIGKAEIKELN